VQRESDRRRNERLQKVVCRFSVDAFGQEAETREYPSAVAIYWKNFALQRVKEHAPCGLLPDAFERSEELFGSVILNVPQRI
jgi:hypothetical protein